MRTHCTRPTAAKWLTPKEHPDRSSRHGKGNHDAQSEEPATLEHRHARAFYNLKTVVSADGRVTDSTVTRTGFRSFVFDPDKGFFLNGKNMKMKGVCLHHDAEYSERLCRAAYGATVWTRSRPWVCNAVRTSHNPQSPDLYDLCDELGMLVLDEAFDEWEYPKRKWLDGWNVGTPGFESSCDFFNEWGERDVADLVRRDRNHVSVFAWSIGNEVDYPNDPYSHPVLDGMGEGDFAQPVYGGYKKGRTQGGTPGRHSQTPGRRSEEIRPFASCYGRTGGRCDV